MYYVKNRDNERRIGVFRLKKDKDNTKNDKYT